MKITKLNEHYALPNVEIVRSNVMIGVRKKNIKTWFEKLYGFEPEISHLLTQRGEFIAIRPFNKKYY
jgi:hypothetical protein